MYNKFKKLRIIILAICVGQTFATSGLIGEGGKVNSKSLIGTNGLIGEGGKSGLIGEAGRVFQEFTAKLKSWASSAGLVKK